MSDTNDKIIKAVLTFAAILAFGSFGYMYFEQIGFWDALYLTIITITTVGYGDIVPDDPGGKIFTVILVVTGVGFVMWVFSKNVEIIVEGGLEEFLGKRHMAREISKLRDHYIICGHGRIGSVIARTLKENNKQFVIIEQNKEEITEVIAKGYVEIEGDAAEDAVLIKAGIERAAGIISVVSSDADNVFITLTARGLNPNINILVRSSGAPGTETKLKRAGANKVISPYFIGARRMAHFAVRPNVLDFLDLSMYSTSFDLQLEEMLITDKAVIKGYTLMETNIRKLYNIIIVGIKRENGEMIFNPLPDTKLLEGDILIALGEIAKLQKMQGQMNQPESGIV